MDSKKLEENLSAKFESAICQPQSVYDSINYSKERCPKMRILSLSSLQVW